MKKHLTTNSTGYNSVSPFFIIHEAQRFIDMIKGIFDAKELRRYDREDGSIMHAEYIPLLTGYVDVAYDEDLSTKKYPLIYKLKAFKINQRFHRFSSMDFDVKITIQPIFEIIAEAPVHPGSIAYELSNFCDTISDTGQLIVKLNKNKVLNYHASNPEFNLIDRLEAISHNPLPANVRIELKEWMGQTDKFVLYSNFALFETYIDEISEKSSQAISKNFQLRSHPLITIAKC